MSPVPKKVEKCQSFFREMLPKVQNINVWKIWWQQAIKSLELTVASLENAPPSF
jgi:hypothetical protein